ncbi:MAG: DUF4352 domain-containing protein [Chloroflexota bacterium]|nr:DUF4352 domain-containing protein [Chloroflexota bacterium]
MKLALAAVAALVAGAALFFGIRALVDRGDHGGVAAFFAVPTRTICGAGTLDLALDRAGFAASYRGRPPSAGGKFLVATLTIVNHGAGEARGLAAHFALREPSGRAYAPDAASDGIAAWRALAPAANAQGSLAFAVPLTLGAAKLVYDDGCTHQEWVTP